MILRLLLKRWGGGGEEKKVFIDRIKLLAKIDDKHSSIIPVGLLVLVSKGS